MKKFYYLILFLLVFTNVNADWELFPLKQKSFYQYENFSEKLIISFSMDTVANRGSYDAQFFNKTHVGAGFINHYACFSDLNPQNIVNTFSNWVNMDSLIVRNDTVFYDSTIYFLPLATTGQSWPFKMQTMTCDSVSVLQFLGVTDSIKYFSSSQFSFVLSKNYGFVKYTPFHNVATNFELYEHSLFGFEDLSGNHGFAKPAYLDFFPYQPGDILVWKSGQHPPWQFPIIYYHRDSIRSVSYGPDTIQYIYDRVTYAPDGSVNFYQNIPKIFLVTGLINQLEAPTNWFAILNYMFGYPSVFLSDKYRVEDDSSFSYVMMDGGAYISDSTNCTFGQASDVYERNTYNTFRGHTAMIQDAFFPQYDSLLGAVLGGIIWGDTSLHVGVNELVYNNKLTVFPNPASDILYIKSERKISTVTVSNSFGAIVRNEMMNGYSFEMDISNLPSAAYILNIIDEKGAMIKRLFIKN